MSIQLGATSINGMYLGATSILTAYLGDTLVFGGGGGGGSWGPVTFTGFSNLWQANAAAIGADNLATVHGINDITVDAISGNTIVLTFDSAGEADAFTADVDTFLFGTVVFNVADSTNGVLTVTWSGAQYASAAATYLNGISGTNAVGSWTDAGAQPLQTITWTMLTNSTATVVSSGLDIIDNDRTSSLFVSPGPRFWNGLEADNYGATNGVFASVALKDAWWTSNYQARIRQDGGVWITMDGNTAGTIFSAGGSAAYNNIGQGPWTVPNWILQAAGQVIDIEVYPKGQLP